MRVKNTLKFCEHTRLNLVTIISGIVPKERHREIERERQREKREKHTFKILLTYKVESYNDNFWDNTKRET